ncbi:MAG: undecaprenyl/decaprenyl-phosphate alpha-N-acetylglucosaminyl 1-phosphate transferase [Candidatus Omnitrophica bacterium]|nr:undecaprenyl/decaprenyl-phosphate alpha-N-acetylglucosaminyl 1-phosphate transferase [Candidatus Omnitrophota bacterium]
MLLFKLIELLALFFFAFTLSIFFLAISRKLSLKHNLFIRDRNIPYIGGVSFSLVFIICLILFSFIKAKVVPFQFIWIITFSFILLLVEWIDDLKDLKLKARVLIQIIFVFLFLLYGKQIQIYFLPNWANYLISFLWIVGITNAFNHLDVADGLCAGIALIVSLACLVIALKTGSFLLFVFVALFGVLLAFLLFNFPPAKIFMGNAGSHFLGFLFATLSIYGDYASFDNILAIFLPLLVLGLPIVDTFYLIVVRASKKISPLRKSDDHIILRYLLKGYSYKRSLASIYFLTAVWCLSAILLLNGPGLWCLIFLIIAFLGTILMIIKANVSKFSSC